MSRVNLASPPGGLLLTAATATATVLEFPPGTYVAMDRPQQMWVSSVELVNVQSVSGTNPELWTVQRGAEGTTAVAHDAGATVERTYPLSEVIYHPQATRLTLPTGTPTYTPDASVKYHFLMLPNTALTAWTIANPTVGGGVEAGTELRLWIKQPSSNRTTVQPTWGDVYDRMQTGGSTLRTVATTASSVTSFSFAWDGSGTAPGAAGSWHLIG